MSACMVSETIATSVGTFTLVQREHGGVIEIFTRAAGQWTRLASRHTWERAEDFAYRYGQEVAS